MIEHGDQAVVAIGVGRDILNLEHELAPSRRGTLRRIGSAQTEIRVPFAGQDADRGGKAI